MPEPLISPEPVPGLPLSDATIEEAPPERPAVQRIPRVHPRVGQRCRIHVPERKTESGKPIPVLRAGTPRRAYQTGEIVRWDDHLVTLCQEGALFATEIVEG